MDGLIHGLALPPGDAQGLHGVVEQIVGVLLADADLRAVAKIMDDGRLKMVADQGDDVLKELRDAGEVGFLPVGDHDRDGLPSAGKGLMDREIPVVVIGRRVEFGDRRAGEFDRDCLGHCLGFPSSMGVGQVGTYSMGSILKEGWKGAEKQFRGPDLAR